ncbi:MAG: hypothetical protein LC539_00180 [Candidatus Thiodiazotropha sp.]|nr:hypothetical protein [Candidatus Thiodiazotropha sp.]MCM8921424.1 hypothetical protein [Candidatus Thiodiazotropha sp.]
MNNHRHQAIRVDYHSKLIITQLSAPVDPISLESAVEYGFVGNPGVPGKASFAVNGYSLNKIDNAAGCAGIFHKFL